jgi:inorganic pyrophosphatase
MKSFRLHDVPPRVRGSKRVNVIIDTPKGSQNKYKYDETLGLFSLSRILPAGMQFPFDFGSVPRTRAEDGDALDVLVLMDAPTFPGCLVTVRLLGVLRARQTENRKTIRNDRLIAMAETSVNRPDIQGIDGLSNDQLEEIEDFFIAYNRAHGSEFKATGKLGPAAAEAQLAKAMRAYAAELKR